MQRPDSNLTIPVLVGVCVSESVDLKFDRENIQGHDYRSDIGIKIYK
jgi:hypothetical protein